MFSRNRSTLSRMITGTVAGMVGGAVASWVMNEHIAAQQDKSTPPEAEAKRQAGGERELAKGQRSGQKAAAKAEGDQSESGSGSGDDATVKTAEAISRNLFEHELTDAEKKIAGPAVHYAYGTLVGGLYGGLSEVAPVVGAGFGMPYGIALWLFGDEAAVPALKLGPPPTEIAPRKHADFLAAHLVFGIALDVTRRVVRRVL